MKNLLIFLFGAACGAGGMLLWLRKDIKKELNKAHESPQNDSELPFTMEDKTNREKEEKPVRSDSGASEGHSERAVSEKEESRMKYNNIINDIKNGTQPKLTIPIMAREDVPEAHYQRDDDQTEYDIKETDTSDPQFVEIEIEEFKHDDEYEKERLVYYQDDHIMATENGTIITNPAILVGSDWERYVGDSADRTAFVRNKRNSIDYEIYVENGTYEDEWGPFDTTTFRED